MCVDSPLPDLPDLPDLPALALYVRTKESESPGSQAVVNQQTSHVLQNLPINTGLIRLEDCLFGILFLLPKITTNNLVTNEAFNTTCVSKKWRL